MSGMKPKEIDPTTVKGELIEYFGQVPDRRLTQPQIAVLLKYDDHERFESVLDELGVCPSRYDGLIGNLEIRHLKV